MWERSYIRDVLQHPQAWERLSHLDTGTNTRRERPPPLLTCQSDNRVNESDRKYQMLNSLHFGICRRTKSVRAKPDGATLSFPLALEWMKNSSLPAEGSSHWLLLERYVFIQYYANAALCTPAILSVACGFPPSIETINTLLQFGFTLQALCECVRADVDVCKSVCICVHVWGCVFNVCVNGWPTETRMWRWKQLFGFGALLRREKKM